MGRGFFMDWRDAVLRWHNYKLPAEAVRHQLEDTLQSRFKNQVRLNETLARFDQYVDHYTSGGFRFQRARMDVRVPLPLDLAERVEVSGEVTRLDRLDHRFIACMLASAETDWRSELRMPLIQAAVTDKLNFLADEVSVAVYTFETGQFEELQYDASIVQAARQELVTVVSAVLQAVP